MNTEEEEEKEFFRTYYDDIRIPMYESDKFTQDNFGYIVIDPYDEGKPLKKKNSFFKTVITFLFNHKQYKENRRIEKEISNISNNWNFKQK